jgi:hypothetical protein
MGELRHFILQLTQPSFPMDSHGQKHSNRRSQPVPHQRLSKESSGSPFLFLFHELSASYGDRRRSRNNISQLETADEINSSEIFGDSGFFVSENTALQPPKYKDYPIYSQAEKTDNKHTNRRFPLNP